LFELQAKIAFDVTKAVAPHIQEIELRQAMRKHPENLTAYDLVLHAKQQLYRLNPEAHARARGLLQQAIILDPGYAPAYSHLAYWHIFRVGEMISTDPEADAVEAARVARAAIERDDADALAISIYGHVQSFLFRDYNAALAHFDRAIKISPNCPEAWSMSSITLGFLGDGAAAVERAEHGLRLSPLDAHLFYKESVVAQAHYVVGQYEAAVAWARQSQVHNPSAMFNDRLLIASLSALGRIEEAQRVTLGILERSPDFRLNMYRSRCPFRGKALDEWISRLQAGGLPA
jgi:tetratricopeptide (TPR) repeat protein